MCSFKQAMAFVIASSLLCASAATAQSSQATQSKPAAQTPAQAPGAPIAGTAPLGVTVTAMDVVIAGWSVKNDVLRKNVMNDRNEKIGTISDVIISPPQDGKTPAASFAIIGVGGFLGVARHDVAIPMEQIRLQGKNLVLPNATKDALKALPPFVYARK
ncbi:MAG: photosystem reaction center subunit [Bradyrhizobium sp.]|nr:photosystem reaction center subunit [Bradyrhizobium sp.]